MDKRQEAEIEWEAQAQEWANDNSHFTESEPEATAFIEGIEDYKSDLKEDVKKKFVVSGIPRDELTLTVK